MLLSSREPNVEEFFLILILRNGRYFEKIQFYFETILDVWLASLVKFEIIFARSPSLSLGKNEKRFVQRLEKLTLVNFPFETNGTHVRVRGCARAQKVARRDKFAESF